MKQRYTVALDCGSTNFKAAVFDATLRRIGECKEPARYAVRTRERVEFDPGGAWRMSVRLIRKACGQAGVRTGNVHTVAITSQANTFCTLAASGQPLTPFMSWQDRRAVEEADLLKRGLGSIFHQHCSWPRAVPGLQAAMLLWLKLHQPHCLEKASAIVTLPGFLAMRLGAANTVDMNLAAMSGLYSLKTRRWWKAMLEICGIDRRQLPELVPQGRGLAKTVACRDLVMGKRTNIVLAGNDQTAGAFGNYCSRQSMLVTLGTALVVYRVMGRRRGPYTAEACWGPYPSGGYYELATSNYGCAALDWARARLGMGRDIRTFTELARRAMARRNEMRNPEQEAFFYPQAINKKRAWAGSADPGERALAVFEGIGFMLKQLIEDELRVPLSMPEIRVTGGGSTNLFWLQLLADILDARVTRAKGDALLGAARISCPRTSATPKSQEGPEEAWFQPRDARKYAVYYKRWKRKRSSRRARST